jgi:hypothetical protein
MPTFNSLVPSFHLVQTFSSATNRSTSDISEIRRRAVKTAMDADLPVDGPKAVPGDDHPSSPPWRNMASESRTEGHSSPHKGDSLSESSTAATLNNSTATHEMKVAKGLMHEDMLGDGESKDVREGVEAVRDEPSRKRVRFSERGRQGSAPPRLELGINDISLPNVGRKGALASPREHVDSIINGNAVVLAAKDEVAQQETGAMARMEGLLDDLETEVTCGLCAGVFIDVSFSGLEAQSKASSTDQDMFHLACCFESLFPRVLWKLRRQLASGKFLASPAAATVLNEISLNSHTRPVLG